jgi:hypothetical protein
VRAGRREVSGPLKNPFAILGELDGHAARPDQLLGESVPARRFSDVHHDQDRSGEVPREVLEDPRERRGSAGRGADHDVARLRAAISETSLHRARLRLAQMDVPVREQGSSMVATPLAAGIERIRSGGPGQGTSGGRGRIRVRAIPSFSLRGDNK